MRTLEARIAAEPSGEVQRDINLYFLRTFYMTPYSGMERAGDFYGEVKERIKAFEKAVL